MDNIGEEREQIEEDIERLNLALQVEGAEAGLQDELQEEDILDINDDSLEHEDYESVDTVYSLISQAKQAAPTDIDQFSGMSEISHLPINAETCLALNRTYQELILESLKRIDLALNENREKQKTLEEGLEMKAKEGSKSTQKQGSKKKSSTLFCKPYFKDKDYKVPPPNSDVEMKKNTQEHKQDITPPMPWSIVHRCKLQDAVKEEAMKHKLVPLMNRKEVYVEKLKKLESELLKINMEKGELEGKEIKKTKELDDLNEKGTKLEQEYAGWQEKIEDLDTEMEKVKETSEFELLFNVDSEKVDWLMIANVIFAGKREERDCQIMWKNVLHPSINKDKWSIHETKHLQELANKYQMKNWPAIAYELGTGRTPFQCLQFYQHSINDACGNRPWTETEDEMLKEVVESVRVGNKISFTQVSYFFDGRSHTQCYCRWNQINPNTKRGRWTLHEDCLLMTAVQMHGCKNWKLVQEYVPGRTSLQCRDRYLHSLDPSINVPERWSYEEDKKLLRYVYSQMQTGNTVRWTKLTSEFPGRTDNQLINRYKRLQTWQMKSTWVSEQSNQQKRQLGVVEGEELVKEITKKGPSKCFKETAQLFPDINKEDYLRQIEDRKRGDLVVPRPPLMTKSITRCFKALWDRKKQLHTLVNQHLQSLKDTVVPHHSTTIKEFKSFDTLSRGQQKAIQNVMTNNPNEITVRDMLNLTKKIARTGNCREARMKRWEGDIFFDEQIKDVLIWKCFHSLLVEKRIGRPRKFYLFSPTGRKTMGGGEDEDEDVEKITDITLTLLMNALDVDYKVALQKSKQMDTSDPAVKENISFLTRVTPSILPAITTPRQPANLVSQNVSATQAQPMNPITNGRSSNTINRSTAKQSTSTCVQIQSAPSTSIGPSTSRAASAENRQLDSIRSVQSTSVSQEKGNSKQTGDKNVSGMKETEGSSIVTGRSATSAADLNRSSVTTAGRHPSTANPSAISAGARIIKLPPGVKLKPGDKIQDILAAHKQAMTSQQAPASPQVSRDAAGRPQKQTIIVRTPTSSAMATGVSQSQGQNVVVIKPPTGLQDPNKVKILPPGAITTCAFKSVLLHRKYLMKKADELYKRQYYKVRGEELQRKINVEVAKQSGSMKVEGGISESALSAGTLNETLHSSTKSVASDIAAKAVKADDTQGVRRDALARVRRTKDYKMLQKRFEALFAWPALLSTIQPENVENGLNKRPNGNSTSTSQKDKKKKRKKSFPRVSVKRGVPYVVTDDSEVNQAVVNETEAKPVIRKPKKTVYPCLKGKHTWRKVVMNREMKKVKREARLQKLRDTMEKKKRGEYQPPPPTRKRSPVVSGRRQSERRAAKKRMIYNVELQETSPEVPKKIMRLARRTKTENDGNAVDNDNFQLLAGDAVVPVALISNISSSIDTGNVPASDGGAVTVSVPQTITLPQAITNFSGQVSSASSAVSEFATSFPLQGAALPMVAITDMHFQTVPSTSSDGVTVAPLIFAVMPSVVGDGQVQQVIANSEAQPTVISGIQNQVVPDRN